MIPQSRNCFCPLKDTMAHVLAICIGVRGVYLDMTQAMRMVKKGVVEKTPHAYFRTPGKC